MRKTVMTGLTGLALLCASTLSAGEPKDKPPIVPEPVSEYAVSRLLPAVDIFDPSTHIKTKEQYSLDLSLDCATKECQFSQAFEDELASFFRRHPRTDRVPEQTVMFNYRESIEYPNTHEFLFGGPAAEQTGRTLASRGSNALLVFFPGIERLGLSLEEKFDDVNKKITFNHDGYSDDWIQDASYGGKFQLGAGDALGARMKVYTRDGKKEDRIDPNYMAREYRPRIDLEWFPDWNHIAKGEMTKGELTLNYRWPLWYDGEHFSIPYVTGTYFFNERDSGFVVRTNVFFNIDKVLN